MAKVGAGTTTKGPISTTFKDAVCPVPSKDGSWASVSGGADLPGGKKATPCEISEVTIANMGPSPGSKVSARGKISNRS
jgi:hypothetical protein